MREIKFRVWDLLSSKFRLDVVVTLDGKVFETQSAGNEINDYTNQSDFILMQYTGLKDKNGVEIYEGDIVNALYEYDVWDETKRKVTEVVKLKLSTNLDTEYTGGPEEVLHYSDIEVIGNIYENQDLLREA